MDFTSVRPTAGGVGSFAVGVAGGMSELGLSHRCLVDPGRVAEWQTALAGSPRSTISGAPVSLPADSRAYRLLRAAVPRSFATGRVATRMRRRRGRSNLRAIGERTVWLPFHRVPLTSGNGVVTVHDLRVFEPGMQSRVDQEIVASNVRRAKAVVCSWPHPYAHVLELFPEAAGKTFLSPLPVLLPGSPPRQPRALSGPLRLLCPASVTQHKNQEVLVRAMALLPSATLVCTGAETAGYAAHVRAIADALGVSDRIRWRGFVSSSELEREYEQAHVMVMPTRWEAASGPIMEAVARELPFVASEIPPIRAQLDQIGIDMPTFAWDAADGLATAIAVVAGDYPRYVRATRLPGERVRARTWSQCAADYADIFAWVAGRGHRPDELAPPPVRSTAAVPEGRR